MVIAGDEIGLGFVGASKGMGAHHRPVDIIGDVLEEARAVAVLQTFEDRANIIFAICISARWPRRQSWDSTSGDMSRLASRGRLQVSSLRIERVIRRRARGRP
jgi:hypothetical protein